MRGFSPNLFRFAKPNQNDLQTATQSSVQNAIGFWQEDTERKNDVYVILYVFTALLLDGLANEAFNSIGQHESSKCQTIIRDKLITFSTTLSPEYIESLLGSVVNASKTYDERALFNSLFDLKQVFQASPLFSECDNASAISETLSMMLSLASDRDEPDVSIEALGNVNEFLGRLFSDLIDKNDFGDQRNNSVLLNEINVQLTRSVSLIDSIESFVSANPEHLHSSWLENHLPLWRNESKRLCKAILDESSLVPSVYDEVEWFQLPELLNLYAISRSCEHVTQSTIKTHISRFVQDDLGDLYYQTLVSPAHTVSVSGSQRDWLKQYYLSGGTDTRLLALYINSYRRDYIDSFLEIIRGFVEQQDAEASDLSTLVVLSIGVIISVDDTLDISDSIISIGSHLRSNHGLKGSKLFHYVIESVVYGKQDATFDNLSNGMKSHLFNIEYRDRDDFCSTNHVLSNLLLNLHQPDLSKNIWLAGLNSCIAYTDYMIHGVEISIQAQDYPFAVEVLRSVEYSNLTPERRKALAISLSRVKDWEAESLKELSSLTQDLRLEAFQ